MKLERRKFLQGLMMLGIGPKLWGGIPTFRQWTRHQSAFAATTSRKLALLVGINQYTPLTPRSDGTLANLAGCVTDVELQKELLIGRYGFQSEDIVTLTDAQATRDQIETAFVEHLIQQAQAGDGVVFHFSGYSSRIYPASEKNSHTQAADWGILPSDGLDSDNHRQDLWRETLFLLARSLATDKITMIFDSSYYWPAQSLQGNFRIRSSALPGESPSAAEVAFQSQLLASAKDKGKLTRANPPGVIITATEPEQIAVEFEGHGFSAGLLTYSLTQYLWEVTPPIRVITALHRINEAIAPLINQSPLQSQYGNKTSTVVYGDTPHPVFGAEAKVDSVEEGANTLAITINLTGLSPLVLQHGLINSCFQVISQKQETDLPETLIQVTERTGLKAQATRLTPDSKIQAGELLQEVIRAIPRHLGLIIALDQQLDRIERVDATSAFAAIANVTEVINAGEHPADCVLGKQAGSYALFTEGGNLLFRAGEGSTAAIKSAIAQFTPKLDQLLAIKYWNLTENEQSSRLGFKATLSVGQGTKTLPILEHATARYLGNPASLITPPLSIANSLETAGIATVAKGSNLHYQLGNSSDQPIYILIMGIDANGKAIAWYSPNPVNPLAPNQTQHIPGVNTTVSWRVSGNSGLAQIRVIASVNPFTQTRQVLGANQPNALSSNGNEQLAQIVEIKNPLLVAQSLLADLHSNRAMSSTMNNNTSDFYCLEMKSWATLNFIYQII
ncbi:MAG: caspase family protein [Snowella sp.]|nr:caspase family protein [Snowella sp.]